MAMAVFGDGGEVVEFDLMSGTEHVPQVADPLLPAGRSGLG